MSQDRRIHQGHVERNRDVILDVLDRFVPADGHVLEIASGTGQHAWYYAKQRPGWTWQPSEPDPERCHRADAWLEAEPLENLRPAAVIDVVEPWQLERATYDVVFNANMIHISPWATCEGLMRGASECLTPEGKLLVYGPFKIGGEHTAPSNAAFSERLRSQDPAWGVRDLEAVVETAGQFGLRLEERVEMPANNFTLVFGR